MDYVLCLASSLLCGGKQAGSPLCISTFHWCLDYETLRGGAVFS